MWQGTAPEGLPVPAGLGIIQLLDPPAFPAAAHPSRSVMDVFAIRQAAQRVCRALPPQGGGMRSCWLNNGKAMVSAVGQQYFR